MIFRANNITIICLFSLALFFMVSSVVFAEISDLNNKGVGNQDNVTGQEMAILLPSGKDLIEVALCKGKIGGDVIECKTSGRFITTIRTDYLRFVAAGWRLQQIVPDNETKQWFYFFQK